MDDFAKRIIDISNNKKESFRRYFSIKASSFFLTRREPIHGGSLRRVLRRTVRKKEDAFIEKYERSKFFCYLKNS
jgi:hypothetical protein